MLDFLISPYYSNMQDMWVLFITQIEEFKGMCP
jgi:hypothetical protein